MTLWMSLSKITAMAYYFHDSLRFRFSYISKAYFKSTLGSGLMLWYDAPVRACSSEDRVLVSGTKGRRFESCQARF
jgi:hypothetical protein